MSSKEKRYQSSNKIQQQQQRQLHHQQQLNLSVNKKKEVKPESKAEHEKWQFSKFASP
jgi:hypothetical protein